MGHSYLNPRHPVHISWHLTFMLWHGGNVSQGAVGNLIWTGKEFAGAGSEADCAFPTDRFLRLKLVGTLPCRQSPSEHHTQAGTLPSGSPPSSPICWISRTSTTPNTKLSFWAHFPSGICTLSFQGKRVTQIWRHNENAVSPSYGKMTVGHFSKMLTLLVGVPGYIKTNTR